MKWSYYNIIILYEETDGDVYIASDSYYTVYTGKVNSPCIQ